MIPWPFLLTALAANPCVPPLGSTEGFTHVRAVQQGSLLGAVGTPFSGALWWSGARFDRDRPLLYLVLDGHDPRAWVREDLAACHFESRPVRTTTLYLDDPDVIAVVHPSLGALCEDRPVATIHQVDGYEAEPWTIRRDGERQVWARANSDVAQEPPRWAVYALLTTPWCHGAVDRQVLIVDHEPLMTACRRSCGHPSCCEDDLAAAVWLGGHGWTCQRVETRSKGQQLVEVRCHGGAAGDVPPGWVRVDVGTTPALLRTPTGREPGP